MTIFSKSVHFSYSIFYLNCSNEIQYFRKKYPERASKTPEMLFLMIYYNFVVAIFNQLKKHVHIT